MAASRPFQCVLRALLDALSVFLWPPSCPGCLQDREADGFCQACAAGLPRIPAPSRGDRSLPGLEEVHALFSYEGRVRDLIQALKFSRNPHPARPFGELLAMECAEFVAACRADALIPVPLSRRRERERGYNQAALLGRPLAERQSLELAPRLLRRVRHTAAQVGLSGEARRRNLSGAFRAEGVLGRSVILIDDVVTTGSTLRECAAALREGGARRIHALGLARADPAAEV